MSYFGAAPEKLGFVATVKGHWDAASMMTKIAICLLIAAIVAAIIAIPIIIWKSRGPSYQASYDGTWDTTYSATCPSGFTSGAASGPCSVSLSQAEDACKADKTNCTGYLIPYAQVTKVGTGLTTSSATNKNPMGIFYTRNGPGKYTAGTASDGTVTPTASDYTTCPGSTKLVGSACIGSYEEAVAACDNDSSCTGVFVPYATLTKANPPAKDTSGTYDNSNWFSQAGLKISTTSSS